MGDLKVFNKATLDDVPDALDTSGTETNTVGELIENLQSKVDTIIQGAPEEMDTLLEVSKELDDDAYQEFLTALNGG